ncbi:hypothetical protein CDV31_007966 [Fusarium ambrosium]|uniref:Uncharacterized protein n=1 Tax=Fusarium ambrosium TaxID=131363 RepID=A0A428U3G7_9HYPO|nr:hypothetical protein CDV31_007966 [Fusarium ambrosium]
MAKKIPLDVLSAGEWKENCRVSDESLTAADEDIKELVARHEASQQRIQDLEKDVSSYRQQVEKLVIAFRNKARKALVCGIALKSAYKIVPSLKDQATIQRVQRLSEKAILPRWVEKEVTSVLKEAGVAETNNSLRTPALTPSRETTNDEEKRHLKRRRYE